MSGINRARQILEFRKKQGLQTEFTRGGSIQASFPAAGQEFQPSTPAQAAAVEEDVFVVEPAAAGGVPMWVIGLGVLGFVGSTAYFWLSR